MMIKLIVLIVSCSFVTVNAILAPFVPCEGRSALSKNISVDIVPCDLSTTNSSCLFQRGDNANFTIYFSPDVNISTPIERVIMAKFAKKLKDKYVEVPYGGGVAADDRTYYIDESGSPQSIEGKGLIAGKPYFFNNIFNILSSSPKTTLWARYLIREAKPCKKSKCNWLLHPGQMLVCVEIPVTIV
ncbi:uncharacterized protein LOC128396934 [Panonychus citri]|uniref:uncharacterized protein LOC128396934 n=1 Tax=Panonychus citri TaxID=50023 RepID=UPI0023077009|nr:uncharacterized protein LOC128396934 [Panonychus citri]